MAARQRIEAVRRACRQLLEQSYRERHEVMLITAGGAAAAVAIAPTRDVEHADRTIAGLPAGGKTPLAAALRLALQQIQTAQRKGYAPAMVVLTDGRANLPLKPGGDPVADAFAAADSIGQAGVDCLVVDTENDFISLGIGRELARRMNARYLRSATEDGSTIASWAHANA